MVIEERDSPWPRKGDHLFVDGHDWHNNAVLNGRRDNLSQANKLSRTYAVLLDALNRYRGKDGQQKVTVEHVDVHAGGQAVVGLVESP